MEGLTKYANGETEIEVVVNKIAGGWVDWSVSCVLMAQKKSQSKPSERFESVKLAVHL